MLSKQLRALLELVREKIGCSYVEPPTYLASPSPPPLLDFASSALPIEQRLTLLSLPKDRVIKIGLSMGTFNPIHLWHLQVAQCSWVQLGLDFVIFIPNGQPPHKSNVAPKELRYEMVKVSTDGSLRFCHSRIELDRDGKSFTVDTLKQLHQLFEAQGFKVELYLIMGMDNVEDLKKWKEAPEILAPGLCKLAIAPRYSNLMSARTIQKHLKRRKQNVDWFLLDSPDSDVSSTQIRGWIASGRLAACADYLVSNKVRQIIADNRLYRQEPAA